jgi:predicted Zn-dependent protease
LTATGDVDFWLLRVASMLEQDPAAAAREAAAIVQAHPDRTAAVLLLGTALRRAGDSQHALDTFTRLSAASPESAVIRLELARALRGAGQPTAAFPVLEEALRLAPDLAEGWRELSGLYAGRADPVQCDAAWARYLALAPEETAHAEAREQLAAGQLEAALTRLRAALARAPEDVFALRLMANAAAVRGQHAQAERLLARCLELAPGYSRARVDLVDVLQAQQKGDEMLPLIERLQRGDSQNLRYRTLLASAQSLLGQSEAAVSTLQQLVGDFPASELAWLSYGHALREAGRGAEAIEAYLRALELKPQLASAWLALANLKVYRFSRAQVESMQQQQTRLRDDELVRLDFALGKALEDQGDYADAFTHYAHGNALRRIVVRYESEHVTRLVTRTCELYTPEFFAARRDWGCADTAPIFIVGLPRAGSTLLEQILASHPEVEGTRELPEVSALARELGDDEERHASAYPRSVTALSREQLKGLGARYLARTRPLRLLNRPHFIDKMGSNFFHVGLIHLMLPNARIIDARRSALGCCFANFKHYFHFGMTFTYSLTDIATYYRDYVRLMEHFEQALPGRIHRVRYEDLVHDLEGEVRRLLDYCGLPFAAECLRFYETRRAVQTVSSEQVRRPIDSAGVEQWKNFEPWLGPLKETLGPLATR